MHERRSTAREIILRMSSSVRRSSVNTLDRRQTLRIKIRSHGPTTTHESSRQLEGWVLRCRAHHLDVYSNYRTA